jgi:hypothetical protein
MDEEDRMRVAFVPVVTAMTELMILQDCHSVIFETTSLDGVTTIGHLVPPLRAAREEETGSGLEIEPLKNTIGVIGDAHDLRTPGVEGIGVPAQGAGFMTTIPIHPSHEDLPGTCQTSKSLSWITLTS